MRKIASLFLLGHSSNSNTCRHPRSKHMEQGTKTSTSRLHQPQSISLIILKRPWTHEGRHPHHPCSAHAAADAGWMSWVSLVDHRENSNAVWCTARPTVGLIARERTEHDEEHKSISIVEEPLPQVARKLHGTRPRSRLADIRSVKGVHSHKLLSRFQIICPLIFWSQVWPPQAPGRLADNISVQ